MIGIVDYGMGNIQSVKNAFERLNAKVHIVTSPEDLAQCSGIILPGVGAFSKAMANLREMRLIAPLKAKVDDGTPVLGICLGMQLLAQVSEEHGQHEGLGIIPGKVRLIPVGNTLRLPHIGWNEVRPVRPGALFKGLKENATFYFVHSFMLECDPGNLTALTDYGGNVTAAIQHGSVFAVQFHPEKSQTNGSLLLRNFIDFVSTYEGQRDAHA